MYKWRQQRTINLAISTIAKVAVTGAAAAAAEPSSIHAGLDIQKK